MSGRHRESSLHGRLLPRVLLRVSARVEPCAHACTMSPLQSTFHHHLLQCALLGCIRSLHRPIRHTSPTCMAHWPRRARCRRTCPTAGPRRPPATLDALTHWAPSVRPLLWPLPNTRSEVFRDLSSLFLLIYMQFYFRLFGSS